MNELMLKIKLISLVDENRAIAGKFGAIDVLVKVIKKHMGDVNVCIIGCVVLFVILFIGKQITGK